METVVLRPDRPTKPIDFQSKVRTARLRAAMMLTAGITMAMAASILSAVMARGESYTATACFAKTVLTPVAAPAVKAIRQPSR